MKASEGPPVTGEAKTARLGENSDPTVRRDLFKQLVAQVSGGLRSASVATGREKRSRNQLDGCANSEEAPIRRTSSSGVERRAELQDAKRIRVDDPPHFPIHAIEVFHCMATSGSEDGQSDHGADSAWWQEVEAQIDDDRKADERWWEEVETSISADANNRTVDRTSLEPDEPGGKRELQTFRCARDAKRIKRPG